MTDVDLGCSQNLLSHIHGERKNNRFYYRKEIVSEVNISHTLCTILFCMGISLSVCVRALWRIRVNWLNCVASGLSYRRVDELRTMRCQFKMFRIWCIFLLKRTQRVRHTHTFQFHASLRRAQCWQFAHFSHNLSFSLSISFEFYSNSSVFRQRSINHRANKLMHIPLIASVEKEE